MENIGGTDSVFYMFVYCDMLKKITWNKSDSPVDSSITEECFDKLI